MINDIKGSGYLVVHPDPVRLVGNNGWARPSSPLLVQWLEGMLDGRVMGGVEEDRGGGVEADMGVSGGEVGGDGEERRRESWSERVDWAKSGAELRRAWKTAGAGGKLSDRDTGCQPAD